MYLSAGSAADAAGSCHRDDVQILFVFLACSTPQLAHTTAEIVPVDADADGVAAFRDCDDADSTIGVATMWWPDRDEDGFGDDARGQVQCAEDNDWIALGGDCDDDNPAINPAIREVCDGRDHDCSGLANDPLWYIDADQDGFGVAGVAGDPIVSCDRVAGRSPYDTDCDDTTWQLSPGMPEQCDEAGIDEDCDGRVNDEDDPDTISGVRTWFADDDRDGFGWRNEWVVACAPPVGFAEAWDDCEDGDPAIHPGAPEQWYDGVDQDCNRRNDFDQDIDGYSLGDDCDDTDASVRPTAEERCDDGRDNDCDGTERTGCAADGATRLNLGGATVSSATSLAWSGADVAAGDLDGDGISDVAIGATGTGIGREGGVYVVTGPVRGEWSLEAAAWRLGGSMPESQFGSAVLVADVDGDGWLDVIGGGAGNPAAGGALYAAFGPIQGSVDLDASGEAYRIDAAVGTSRSWQTLASAGDIDGDGADDFLAGAVAMGSGGPTALWFVRGNPSRALTLGDGVPVTSADGAPLSTSASGGADLDGDGVLDMAIGVPERGGGVVYIVSGDALEGCNLDDSGVVIEASGRDAAFGISVSAGGDTDGDGRVDLLVGAASFSHDTGIGGAFLFRNLSGSTHRQTDAVASFTSPSRVDAAGATVDARGDVNGDALADLVIGAPMAHITAEQEGAIYVVLSPVDGVVDLTKSDGTLFGISPWNRAGSALATDGDFDDDGADDLLIGAPSAATTQTLAGQTYVVYGAK